MGTASYCTSPGATGPCSFIFELKLGPGAVGVVGVLNGLWLILGVADGAFVGGACSLNGLSADLLWAAKEDCGSAI